MTEESRMSTCPVCDNSRWLNVYKVGRWNIGECPSCGFARIDPMPAREERMEFYSAENVIARNAKRRPPAQRLFRAMKRLFAGIGHRNKSAIFYNKLSRYLAAGSKVLDVGCGDGSFLKSAKRSFACTGIEISEYLGALAREQDDITVMNGDFLTLDIGDERFDGITLISILEHMDNPGQVIKKCFDLMNAGGVLVVKTVNYGCLNRMIRGPSWSGFRPPDHVVYFTPQSIQRLLKKAGFAKIVISAWPFNDNMYCDAWKQGPVRD